MSAIARNAKIAKSDDLKTWPRVRVFVNWQFWQSWQFWQIPRQTNLPFVQ
jgi:hypothetical protein